ncbi:MAG: 16S rRNA (uracil(1498)-N(3))-methyltransferase [Ornithinimicrobium sp.]
MSLPLFLVHEHGLTQVEPGSTVSVTGPEGRHAVTVTRIKPGELVLVSDGCGTVARCRVSHVGKAQMEAQVEQVDLVPAPDPSITLVQALAKSDRDHLAIEVATELGVDEVVPWQADRSVVRWRGERAQKGAQKWQHTLTAATKQARRSRIPRLAPVAGREQLQERIAAAARAWVLHEDAQCGLADVVSSAHTGMPGAGEAVVVVGPEGGISDAELRAFTEAGAYAVRLGPTVLRTSTAGSAAIAVLSAASRWRT